MKTRNRNVKNYENIENPARGVSLSIKHKYHTNRVPHRVQRINLNIPNRKPIDNSLVPKPENNETNIIQFLKITNIFNKIIEYHKNHITT